MNRSYTSGFIVSTIFPLLPVEKFYKLGQNAKVYANFRRVTGYRQVDKHGNLLP